MRRDLAVPDREPGQEKHDQVHADEIHIGTDIRREMTRRDNNQHVADHGRNQGTYQPGYVLSDGLFGSAGKENTDAQHGRE